MYAPFFGLTQEPFSIAPDPRYLYMSERHREALAHLLYGLSAGGGFVLLTGAIGAGKTTVCRCFLEQVPRRCNVAYIFNPKLTVNELLKTVCDEFGIPDMPPRAAAATVKEYLDPLNEFLLRTHAVGQNNVLIIDEAQSLSADVLEQLRLLTNLETNERKLLQIILIGQPELRKMLARPELEQLAQRVIARFHLDALSQAETEQYIAHRLAVAGMTMANPFDRETMQRIHRLARGVPRRINMLCDRALLGAYASGKTRIDRPIVDKAAREVFGRRADGVRRRARRKRMPAWGMGLATVAGAALLGVVIWLATTALQRPPARSARAAAPVPASAAQASSAAAATAPGSAPARAAASPMTLSTLEPLLTAATGDETQAWGELAKAWNLELGDGDPCQAAASQNVHCFRRDASNLALIRQLDRPGILTLYDAANRPVPVLLTRLTDQTATLRVGAASHTVALAELARAWRGDFATFWRAPDDYRSVLAAGSTGPLVETLSNRLARLDGTPPAAASGKSFDAALESRVSAFQRAHGLEADGIAGPTTFMQLNRALGIDEPHLRANASAAR
ncbi:MAG TPA: AAA family ATPase [Burkholderiaceae bacterium]|nr:AAA family ATPase [Burkholderiaceae bacterium]